LLTYFDSGLVLGFLLDDTEQSFNRMNIALKERVEQADRAVLNPACK
jgi:hypothetical protein